MNKVIIIGIIILGIVVGILSVIFLGSFSVLEDGGSPILENEEMVDKEEPKPQGRDLSVEFDEKMGLSAP